MQTYRLRSSASLEAIMREDKALVRQRSSKWRI